MIIILHPTSVHHADLKTIKLSKAKQVQIGFMLVHVYVLCAPRLEWLKCLLSFTCMAYAQSARIVVQKYFGIDMYVYAFIFCSESPHPHQNSGHVLNLLTVHNKHSWGWLCVPQSQPLELKFFFEWYLEI